MGKYINPFTDAGFKLLFGQEVSKELLIAFLNVLLEGERQVVDITFLDKERRADVWEGRMAVFDILCQEKDGTYFIVEMQNRSQLYFFNRSLFYLCRMISGQGRKGEEWKFGLCPVYGIYFLNFRLEPLSKLRTDVILADRETGRQIDGKLRQIYISLPYFELEANECTTDFERWIYMIKNMNTLERMPFEAQKAVFRKLLEIAEIEKLSPADRRIYDKRLKEYRDYVNTVNYAKEEGIAEGIEKGIEKGIAEGIEKGMEKGIEKGIEKGKHQIAFNMKRAGVDIKIIVQTTGLSRQEINRLEEWAGEG